jgi:hypothetical protein
LWLRRRVEAGAAGPAFRTAARVWKRILTWFLEAKRWQKLNEDTPPCFLAVGELPSAAALARWLRLHLEIDDVVSDSRSGDRDRDFRR